MPELPHKCPLILSAKAEGEIVVCALAGEIDLKNSGELRADMLGILKTANIRKLVINLEKVPYMDSSGVAVFVESMQKMRKINGKIVLTNLQPRVKGLLEIARLMTLFVIAESEAEGMTK